MPVLTIDSIIISILAVIATASIFFNLYLITAKKGREAVVEKLVEENKAKGYNILNQAVKKAQAIMGVAEIEGIKITEESRHSTDKFLEEYNKSLKDSLTRSQQVLAQATTQATQTTEESTKQFNQFLSELRSRSDTAEFTAAETVRQRINQLFENFETRLSDFLVQTEQKSMTAIELELRSARRLIETYKSEQLRVVDENIIAMLEQTLNLVLAKKLSLQDQMDLVYESLERAKIEKFII